MKALEFLNRIKIISKNYCEFFQSTIPIEIINIEGKKTANSEIELLFENAKLSNFNLPIFSFSEDLQILEDNKMICFGYDMSECLFLVDSQTNEIVYYDDISGSSKLICNDTESFFDVLIILIEYFSYGFCIENYIYSDEIKKQYYDKVRIACGGDLYSEYYKMILGQD